MQPYVYGLSYKGKLSYIGIHNGKDKYYFSGGSIPRKLGKEKFIKGIIEYCDDADLCEKEMFYIEKYKPKFNLTSGGERFGLGTKHSKEVINKRRESLISNKDHIMKISKRFSEMNKIFNARSKRIINKEDSLEFNSIRDAAKYYGLDNSFLSKHLKGIYETVKGMKFEVIK
jgi:hypothetical protein